MRKNEMSIEVRSGFVAALQDLVGLRQKNVAWAHSAATVDRSGYREFVTMTDHKAIRTHLFKKKKSYISKFREHTHSPVHLWGKLHIRVTFNLLNLTFSPVTGIQRQIDRSMASFTGALPPLDTVIAPSAQQHLQKTLQSIPDKDRMEEV